MLSSQSITNGRTSVGTQAVPHSAVTSPHFKFSDLRERKIYRKGHGFNDELDRAIRALKARLENIVDSILSLSIVHPYDGGNRIIS